MVCKRALWDADAHTITARSLPSVAVKRLSARGGQDYSAEYNSEENNLTVEKNVSLAGGLE